MTRALTVLLCSALVACGGGEPAPAPAPTTPAPAPVAAPTPPPAAPVNTAAAAVDGGAIYKQYCEVCHGADGKGNNGMAANYVDDKTRLSQPDEVLLASIKNGKTGTVGSMPARGGILNDEQQKAVLAHVRATFGGGAAPAGGAPPAAPAAGAPPAPGK